MTTTTKLQINWTNNGCDCGNCDFTVETVKGSDSQLFDGDKVVCNKCNKIGEIEALGIDGCDVIWSYKYQTKATKCIAVKTPYGLMYLELSNDGVYEGESSDDQIASILVNTKIYPYENYPDWVELESKAGGRFIGFFEVSSHYGDQFPQ